MRRGTVSLLVFLLVLFPWSVEAALSPKRSVLRNGLVLLSSEQRSLPIVTLHLLIDAGSRSDPPGLEGLASLTARLLTYGTKKRTATEISDALDSIGALLSTSAGEELATVSLTVLRKDLDAGLDLLAEILTAATFPAEEIERQKEAVVASIKAKSEDPGQIADMKFREALFPGSPYGRPVEGTEESIRRIDRKDLAEFYERYYRPDRSILAVVGDISDREIAEKLRSAFRSWRKGAPIAEAPPSAPGGPAKTIRMHRDLTQANIIMGHEGVPRGHADYYAIQVMNHILGGGGLISRLVGSVRNERGLAYSVYSSFSADKYSGVFQIEMQTKNETAEEAIRVALEEIRKIREEGVTEDELQEAKDYLIGSFPLRLDTSSRIASFLAYAEYFGLGLDYPERYPDFIRKISREDVLRVARQYIRPEKLITVVVADQKKAQPGK